MLSTFENRCKDKEFLFDAQILCFKNMLFSIFLCFYRKKRGILRLFLQNKD